MMHGTSSTPHGPATVFTDILGQWTSQDDTPDVVSIRVREGVPTVTYQTADDDDLAAAASETWQFMGAAVKAFDAVDYRVDRAEFLALPHNRESHPGGLRWHIDVEWARAYHDDAIGREELGERVDASMELVEDLNE